MRAFTSALAAGRRHSVARRRDGTVVAAGANSANECRVEHWEDVIAALRATFTQRPTRVGLTRSDFDPTAPCWRPDGMATINVT